MARKSIDFASILSQGVPKSDTGPQQSREQIEYIDIVRLDEDPNNFYELSGLQELAANIELCGLQQPIRIRDNPDSPGRYIIVSGHRRRAAIQILVDEGRPELREVPCIREQDAGSDAMRELRLIYANAATREMTSAEKAKQAERVKELLYQLKEQGVEFPGRMRDHVAEACNISKSKLARLEVIQKQLEGDLMLWYGQGTLSEQAAYALARMPMEVQWTVAEQMAKKKTVPGACAENLLQYLPKITEERTCSYGFPGDKCDNQQGRIKACVAQQYSWNYCEGRCCMTCYKADSCPGKCQHKTDAMKQEREEAKLRKDREEREQAATQAKRRRQSTENAKRLLRAVEAAGLTDKDTVRWSRQSWLSAVEVGELRKKAAGEWGDACFNSVAYNPADTDAIRLAPELGCSADYLLGLSDELTPQPKPPAEGWLPLQFVDGHHRPPRAGMYYCAANCDGHIFHEVFEWDDSMGGWLYRHHKKLDPDVEIVRWFPLPDDEEDNE